MLRRLFGQALLPGLFMVTLGAVFADSLYPPSPWFRDPVKYPPLHLTWNASTDIKQVRGVFPHPVLTQLVVVSTETGLLLSGDTGRTWTPLPEATADKVGPISDVAYHPTAPDTFYLASQTKGVWMTTDKGKTFTQLGTKAAGMASDTVLSFIVYPGDTTHQTLLAAHGDAALGLSRSRDGGKTWDVVNPEYHFRRVLGGAGTSRQLYFYGSTPKEPDILSVYCCTTVGEFLAEVQRDVVPTDMISPPQPYQSPGAVYVTTSDSGLYRINNESAFGLAHDSKALGQAGQADWASVASTWGPNADVLNLYLYDATKLGLVISSDDLATYQTASDGLPVGALVKEGAVVRPNANGTVFYNVANDALSIGRQADDVPVVELSNALFEVGPNDEQEWRNLTTAFQKFDDDKGGTVAAAKTLIQSVGDLQALYHRAQIVVTARLPLKPAPPTSVTVDLSRFGGLAQTQMFDDGQHNDGAAGDGVYGASFAYLPFRCRAGGPEWRTTWPGKVAMGVAATFANGHHTGAVGVVSVLEQVPDMGMWSDGPGSATTDLEGGVVATVFKNPLAPGQPDYAPRRHKGDVAMKLDLPKGAWTVHLKAAYNKHDFTSHVDLAYYLRLDAGAAPKEMNLQLKDEPEFSPPTTTDKISALKGLTLTANYQRVILPVPQVIGNAALFQTDHLSEIILSGTNDAPGTITIDGLVFLANDPLPNASDPDQ